MFLPQKLLTQELFTTGAVQVKKCLPQDLCNRRLIFLQQLCIKDDLYTQELCITEEVPQLRAVYVRRSIYYKSFVAEAMPTTIAV